MPEYFYLRFGTLWDLSKLGFSLNMLVFVLRVELVSPFGTDFCACDAALRRRSQTNCTSPSLRIEMERTLYFWSSSKERVADDLHLVVLVDREGAHIVFMAQL